MNEDVTYNCNMNRWHYISQLFLHLFIAVSSLKEKDVFYSSSYMFMPFYIPKPKYSHSIWRDPRLWTTQWRWAAQNPAWPGWWGCLDLCCPGGCAGTLGLWALLLCAQPHLPRLQSREIPEEMAKWLYLLTSEISVERPSLCLAMAVTKKFKGLWVISHKPCHLIPGPTCPVTWHQPRWGHPAWTESPQLQWNGLSYWSIQTDVAGGLKPSAVVCIQQHIAYKTVESKCVSFS